MGKGIKTEFKLHFRLNGAEIGDGVRDVELEAQGLRHGFNLCVAPLPVKQLSQNLRRVRIKMTEGWSFVIN